jgi:hypothetical protein
VTERDQRSATRNGGELAEAAPRDVFEEDSFNRLLCTEGEDLFERRVDEPFVRDGARL